MNTHPIVAAVSLHYFCSVIKNPVPGQRIRQPLYPCRPRFLFATLNVNESFFLPPLPLSFSLYLSLLLTLYSLYSRRFYSFVYPERPTLSRSLFLPPASSPRSWMSSGHRENRVLDYEESIRKGVATPIVDSPPNVSFRFSSNRAEDPLWIGRS